MIIIKAVFFVLAYAFGRVALVAMREDNPPWALIFSMCAGAVAGIGWAL